ncbi:type II toxin-antitoxin system HicA family toxin [Alcaligenaceae bacterium]|nr:type II toxin-antitoxin system HicA family toxin [Alcaligenaceae bacterium]
MAKRDKLTAKIYSNPSPKDFRFDELITLLQGFGFVMHEKTGGSSHKYFVRTLDSGEVQRIDCSCPHPGGILKIYQIKQICIKLTQWGLA